MHDHMGQEIVLLKNFEMQSSEEWHLEKSVKHSLKGTTDKS